MGLAAAALLHSSAFLPSTRRLCPASLLLGLRVDRMDMVALRFLLSSCRFHAVSLALRRTWTTRRGSSDSMAYSMGVQSSSSSRVALAGETQHR